MRPPSPTVRARPLRPALAALVLLAVTAVAHAAATPLDAYLDNLKSLRASFLQTLADPHGREVDRATGTLIVSRPGRFAWDIHPQNAGGVASGAGQLMVCDGTNLWFLDRDLQQVTVKPVDAALTASPAMLLSGTQDLRQNFKITPAGSRTGLEWVLAEPKAADADFRSALFGFANGELKRMIVEDKLGQTATIMFEQVTRNVPVPPAEVSFTPPKDVDVIGTPHP